MSKQGSLWDNHKNKIIGGIIGLIMTCLGTLCTYVVMTVNYYESEQEKKEIVHIIDSLITMPETLAKVLSDTNVLAAQKTREEELKKHILEDAVHNKQPDSLKLSTRCRVSMDLKMSQKVEDEIGWMYRFCKFLKEERKNNQGVPFEPTF